MEIDDEFKRKIDAHIDGEERQFAAVETSIDRIHVRIDRLEMLLDRVSDDVAGISTEQREQKEFFAPLHAFLVGLENASSAGRLLRGIIGWLVFFVGVGAMAYISVTGTTGAK